jgi:hypothetical protein
VIAGADAHAIVLADEHVLGLEVAVTGSPRPVWMYRRRISAGVRDLAPRAAAARFGADMVKRGS